MKKRGNVRRVLVYIFPMLSTTLHLVTEIDDLYNNNKHRDYKKPLENVMSSKGTYVSSSTMSFFGGLQNFDNLILCYNSPYSRLLQRLLLKYSTDKENNDKKICSSDIGHQNLVLASNGNEYFSNSHTNAKSTFGVLAHITNDLLEDIPVDEGKLPNAINFDSESVKPSLFQGFSTMLSAVEDVVESSKSSHSGSLHSHNKEFVLPYHFDPEYINRSYSTNALNGILGDVFSKLDSLKVQKISTQSEIEEINKKLERLNFAKELMIQKVTNIEKNEESLRNSILSIKSRKDFIKEYGLEGSEVTDDHREDEILDHYLTEANNLLEENSDGIQFNSSLSSPKTIPLSPPMQSVSTNSISSSLGETLQRFYDGPHKKQKFISTSLQAHYRPGSTIATFKNAHVERITTLDFDFPFGTACTAGHLEHSIKIWDLSKRRQIGSLDGHLATINCLEMDSTYNMVVSGSKDATLKLWNIDFGVEKFNGNSPLWNEDPCMYTFESHTDEITALSMDQGSLVSGSRDKTIKQWDLKTGKCLQSIDIGFASRGYSKNSFDLNLYNPIEPTTIGTLQCYDAALATGTKDGRVRLWDLRIGKVIRTLNGHTDAISSLKFDTTSLVTGSFDKTAKLWDLRTGTTIDSYSCDSPVLSVDFDEKKIVVAPGEGNVKVIDRTTGEHWNCGNINDTTNHISTSKYKDNYMIEGHTNGDINVWSV